MNGAPDVYEGLCTGHPPPNASVVFMYGPPAYSSLIWLLTNRVLQSHPIETIVIRLLVFAEAQ
jgi:hypothetical protein